MRKKMSEKERRELAFAHRGEVVPDSGVAIEGRKLGRYQQPQKVLIVGDLHGNGRWARAVIERLPELLPNEDRKICLQAGDFGIWPESHGAQYIKDVNEALEDQNAELWFVDGNHEDHDKLDELYAAAEDINAYIKIAPRIRWLPRGYRWNWHGRTWLGVGGAASVDKAVRVEGVSWWPQEALTGAQIDRISADGEADVILSHECPTGVPLNLPRPAPYWWDLETAERHRVLFGELVCNVKPQWLIHGHYHLYHQTVVNLGYGPVEVTGLDCDGTWSGNYKVLDVVKMEWA